MRKPRLSEKTTAELEMYGYATTSKYYYELKEYTTPEGNRYTLLERTDTKIGKTEYIPWTN